MQKIISRSPGEIFFFGEHSVVYGKKALTAAIDRWVTTTLTRDDGYARIISRLGKFEAKINGLALEDVKADNQLAVFKNGIERVFERFGSSTGFNAVIESELPAGSGLASSAASSASLLGGIIALMGRSLDKHEMVRLVFKSEIDIQKRGSISGSACTVLGGVVEMEGNDFHKLEFTEIEPCIVVADSRQSLLTSESTGWIKEAMDKDRASVNSIFDSMHDIAGQGKSAMRKMDWQDMGRLMSENHSCLKRLGVSTKKIEDAISAVSAYAYGSKITGAGGGGCFVSICDRNKAECMIGILRRKGFDAYVCGITATGHHIL